MKCPKCGGKTVVFDSRPRDGTIWRRRKCTDCGYRYSSYEMPLTEKARYEKAEAIYDRTKKAIEKAQKAMKNVIKEYEEGQ